MSFGDLGALCLAVYLVALIGLAEVARRARRDHSPDDHFLASRGLGFFVLLMTLYATTYSGNSLLGYPGEGYRRGYAWIISTGMMMSIMVTFQILVPKLRPLATREGFVTPGDFLRHRFAGEPLGRALEVAVAALMILALGNFLLAQLVAMGHVTGEVTGGLVPYWVAVVGLAAFILVYETLGGMRAVAWTDTAQGLLMLVGLGLLLHWVAIDGAGLAGLAREVARVRPEAVAVPDWPERWNWISTVVLLGFGGLMYPQAIQRIFAARSGGELKRALALMGFMPLTTTFVVMLIGIAAIPRFAGLGTVEADTVMPRLLSEWAATSSINAVFAVAVFIGALAAIMSTADSVLLSLGSVIACDLLGRDRHDPATTRTGKRAAALVMLIALGFALMPKLSLWRLIELKMEILIQCAPAFLVAIHWKRFSARAALCGLVVGTTVAVGAALGGFKRIEGFHIGVIGAFANLLVALVVTYVDRGRQNARKA